MRLGKRTNLPLANEALPSPLYLVGVQVFENKLLLDIEVESEHWLVRLEIMFAELSSIERQNERFGGGRAFALVVVSMG